MFNIIKKKICAFWTWQPSFFMYVFLLIAFLPAVFCFFNERRDIFFKVHKTVNASHMSKTPHGPYSYCIQSISFTPSAKLFEDGKLLPQPNSKHEDIGKHGAGRYSVWGKTIYFSSSDNSDPRTNGKKYEIQTTLTPPVIIKRGLQVLALLSIIIILLKFKYFPQSCLMGKHTAKFFLWSPGIWYFVLLFILAIFFACLIINDWTGFVTEERAFDKSKINPASAHGKFAYSISPDFKLFQYATITEDGKKLPFSDSIHADIGRKGMGRYSVWGNAVYFSSSDNSDPRTNSKEYKITVPVYISPYAKAFFTVLFIASAILFILKINYLKKPLSYAYDNYTFAFIIILSVFLHVLAIFSTPIIFVPDTDSYLRGTLTLLEDGSFCGVATFRGPGLALLYAPVCLIFQAFSLWPLKIFLHIIAVGCNIMTYLVAYELTGKKWIALISGLLAIVWIDGFLYSAWVSSEISSALTVLSFTYFLIKALRGAKAINYYMAALSAGASALIRPENAILLITFVFFALFTPMLSYWKKKDRSAKRIIVHVLLAAFLAGLPLLAWSTYNFYRAGFFGLTSYSLIAIHDSAIVSAYTLKRNIENDKNPAVQFIKQSVLDYNEYCTKNCPSVTLNPPFANTWHDFASLKFKLIENAKNSGEQYTEIGIAKKIDKIFSEATMSSIFANPCKCLKMQLFKSSVIFNGVRGSYVPILKPEQLSNEWVPPWYIDKTKPKYRYTDYFQFETDKIISPFIQKIFKFFYSFNSLYLYFLYFIFVIAIPGYLICLIQKPFLVWFFFIIVTFSKTIFAILLGAPSTRVMFQGTYLQIILGVCTIWTLILILKSVSEKIKEKYISQQLKEP